MKEKMVLAKEIKFLEFYQAAIEKGYMPIISSRNLLASIDYISSLYEERYKKDFFMLGLNDLKIVDCEKEFPKEIIDIMNCYYKGNLELNDNEILIYINNLITNKTEFITSTKDGKVLNSPLKENDIFLKDVYNELKVKEYDTEELRKIIFSHHFNKSIMEETAKLAAIKIMCYDDGIMGIKRAKSFINDLNNSFDKFYMTDLFINEFAIELKKQNKLKLKLKLF